MQFDDFQGLPLDFQEVKEKASAEFIVFLASVFTHINNEKGKKIQNLFCFLFPPFSVA